MHTPSESATRTHNAVVKDRSLSVRDVTIKALPHTSVKPTASEGASDNSRPARQPACQRRHFGQCALQLRRRLYR
jgi:hypothetical protein